MKPAPPLSLPAMQSAGAAAELVRRWRIGKPLDLELYLAEWTASHVQTSITDCELAELASIDQRERWRRGQRPPAEEYLSRFPQLAADAELALDVIYNEFLVRESLGDGPSQHEFQVRFPQLADTLRDQIEFHQALGVDGAGALSTQDTHRAHSAAQQTTGPIARLPAQLSRFVPGYEILAELGRGGMGVVYKARQLSLNRLVALKMLRAGDCGSLALLARFQAEAEAVARLHHPQIVQIYDYGEYDGLPYLALELVEGGSLAELLDGAPRPPREAAEMVAALALAVQFAHEQGIVHRDLKPANVLVSAPDRDRAVSGKMLKITDFGLAKVFHEGSESPTQSGAILGTPSYMSPEQARGQSQLIGPAADVYSLGAILYELLTGRPPFKSATTLETLNQLLTCEPISPARLVPRLPRDLATIATRCLQKEPHLRYVSAAELADDLASFLGDRPIRARRTSLAERGWRWCHRNRALASLAGSVAVLLIAVTAVSLTYSLRLRRQLGITSLSQHAERDARRIAETRLWDAYLAEINAAYGSRRIGQRAEALVTVDRANELLDSIGRTPQRVLQLRNAAIATLARPDLRHARTVAPSVGITSVDLSVAADRYLAATSNELSLHRLSDGAALCRIPTGDTQFVAAISADGRFVAAIGAGGATVWRCEGQRSIQVWQGPGTDHFTFGPDSRQAAVSDPAGGMRLIDLESGRTERQLGTGPAQSRFAFHAASRRIAVCTPSGLRIIDWDTGQVLVELLNDASPSRGLGVAWHPQGDLVAVSGRQDGVELWDVAAKRLRTVYPQRGYITAPWFSRGGDHLLTYDEWSSELRVWNVGTGQVVLRAPTFGSFSMDRSAGERDELLQMGKTEISLCRLEPGLATHPFPQITDDSLGDVNQVDISPDGRFLAVGGSRGFELLDLVSGRRTGHGGDQFWAPAFDGAGNLLVACRWGLYRLPRRESTATEGGDLVAPRTLRFGPPEKLSGPLSDSLMEPSADGSVLAVQARTGWQALRPLATPGVVDLAVDMEPRCVSVSPDGRWIALSNWENARTTICDSTTGRREIVLPTGRAGRPLFSPDGRWLATTPDGVCLWSVPDWSLTTQVHALGTTANYLGICFSPDSRVLAVGQPHGIARLVDPATGADLAELVRPDVTDSAYMAFTPDQSRLIEIPAGDRGAPRIWNLTEIRRELAHRGLDWPADVLREATAPDTLAVPLDTIVTLDEGSLSNLQAVADLIREAGDSKNDHARDLLERAIELDPDSAYAHNQLAWLLVTCPDAPRDPPAAVRLARRALQLDESQPAYWNTLGVALYRDGQDREAVEILEQSLQRGGEATAAYDLVFLALAHLRLGDSAAAQDYYNRAAAWLEQRRNGLSEVWKEELTMFVAEAEAAGLAGGD